MDDRDSVHQPAPEMSNDLIRLGVSADNVEALAAEFRGLMGLLETHEQRLAAAIKRATGCDVFGARGLLRRQGGVSDERTLINAACHNLSSSLDREAKRLARIADRLLGGGETPEASVKPPTPEAADWLRRQLDSLSGENGEAAR